MEQTGYQIVHAINGRIRIRISWLGADSESASKLQRLVESLSFVTSVRINPLANSIVVSYRPRNITIDEAQDRFVDAIQQVKPTPLMVPPPPPEPPSPEPPTAPSTPNAASNASVWVDIPSPWDDPIASSTPSNAQLSNLIGGSIAIVGDSPKPSEPDLIEESIAIGDPPNPSQLDETRTDPNEPDASGGSEQLILSPHTTALLAQRLGVTSQAITRRRSSPDFATWSQAQDPQEIAWHYDAESRSFHTIKTHSLS